MNHERKDASLEVIGIGAATLAALIVCSIIASALLYRAIYSRRAALPGIARETSFAAGPAEKPGIVVDYGDVMHQSDEHLQHYGWVDEKAGVVRVPIDRAMALLVGGAQPAPTPKDPSQRP